MRARCEELEAWAAGGGKLDEEVSPDLRFRSGQVGLRGNIVKKDTHDRFGVVDLISALNSIKTSFMIETTGTNITSTLELAKMGFALNVWLNTVFDQ